MVGNIFTQPLGLVLIVTAHMVFYDPSQAAVTGILGNNITLQFIFNVSVTKDSHVAVYRSDIKIVECKDGTCCSGNGEFEVDLKNKSLFCHISNLRLNHSQNYTASLFMSPGQPPKESNKVQLIVREENTSTTVSPVLTNSTPTRQSESSIFFSYPITAVLVVLSIVLSATILPWSIWCLVRTKDKQQPQKRSRPTVHTVQETVEASSNVPASTLVYSVLDFPKRPSAVLEMNPNDTEYAAVSYLPEKRGV